MEEYNTLAGRADADGVSQAGVQQGATAQQTGGPNSDGVRAVPS
jgi:hypothetical protein